MNSSEIDNPGHLIGVKPRRFPKWGARQQPNQDLSTMRAIAIVSTLDKRALGKGYCPNSIAVRRQKLVALSTWTEVRSMEKNKNR